MAKLLRIPTPPSKHSLADLTASLPEKERNKRLRRLPEEQRIALQWDWRYWGRLEQQPPSGEWRTRLLLARQATTKSANSPAALLDSTRYRAVGNAVTPQVAEWVAKRLAAALRKANSATQSRPSCSAQTVLHSAGDGATVGNPVPNYVAGPRATPAVQTKD